VSGSLVSLYYKYNPVAFAVERLGLEADAALVTLLTSEADELLYLAARQTGKTTGFAARGTHHAVFTPDGLTVIVSATQRQAQIVQRRTTQYLRALRRPERWHVIPGRDAEIPEDVGEHARLVRCSSMSLELANGHAVISVPASPDTVRGYSPTLLILDECRAIPDPVYGAVRPMRAATGAALLAGSSAGPQRGWFYEEWRTADPGWARLEVKAADCPRIARDFLARERGKLPAATYSAEYENVFMPMSGRLFTPEMLARLIDTDHEVEPIHSRRFATEARW